VRVGDAARLSLPADLLTSAPTAEFANSRIADFLLPNHGIGLELTLERATDLALMTAHKQSQLADYYRIGIKPIIISPC
jgi:hypothetical protein